MNLSSNTPSNLSLKAGKKKFTFRKAFGREDTTEKSTNHHVKLDRTEHENRSTASILPSSAEDSTPKYGSKKVV